VQVLKYVRTCAGAWNDPMQKIFVGMKLKKVMPSRCSWLNLTRRAT